MKRQEFLEPQPNNFEHPEQPQHDLSAPELTFKSQTLKMHNSENETNDNNNISGISPVKQSF